MPEVHDFWSSNNKNRTWCRALRIPRQHSQHAEIHLEPNNLACVASVSVGFSARSRHFHWHFSLFGGAKLGASATLIFALAPIFARS